MGASKKRTGSQKKPSKSKSTVASRREQRKATGQAAQKAGTGAFTKARVASRASERRKKEAKKTAASTAAANRQAAASRPSSTSASTAAANQQAAASRAAASRAAAARAAAAARMQAVNNPPSAPRTPPEMSPRNIAAQQAAARQAAAQRAAQAARMMAVNNPPSASRRPPEMDPRVIAAQQAAARAAAAREANVGYGYTPTSKSSSPNRTSASTAAANKQAAESLLGAGYRNVKGDKNKSTILQQIMSGFRNTLRGEGLPGDNQLTAKPITTDGPSTRLPPPLPEISCPTPDMRILMADGSLKVAGELQVGDIVKTAHEDTLEWGDHKVTHKDIVESEVVSLKFENSSIKCSPTHKVYLSNDSKWTEVQDLKEGDVVKVQDGDDTFVSLEKIDSGEVVVLTVEDAHTYIAEGILAHNKTLAPGVTTTTPTTTTLPPPVMPPVMPPQFPQYPGYGGGMMGGIGAFGYNPALMQFESQQGAGQVPYYMAAARNAQTPNMSPAFMHAARNYDILGGSQRTAPRPMEMMSAAERAQIAGMSNFNTPNYNSPYDQFNFFSNMVGGGGGGGKGMGRPAPQMAGGLAPFMSGMFR